MSRGSRAVNVEILLPRELVGRIDFLRKHLPDAMDQDDVIRKSLHLLDVVVCSVTLEGGTLLIRNKDGSIDPLKI